MLQILIDNGDGLGYKDYSSLMCYVDGASIKRSLNRPSSFQFTLLLVDDYVMPTISSLVSVLDGTGNPLFKGCVYSKPLYKEYGAGLDGRLRSATFIAYTPDIMLRSSPCRYEIASFNISEEQAWNKLLAACTGSNCVASMLGQDVGCARFVVNAGSSWSDAADVLAATSLSTYRWQDDQLLIVPYGQASHTATQYIAEFKSDSPFIDKSPRIATDVLVVGQIEPASYVHDVFQGDGATAVFALSQKRFVEGKNQRTSFLDMFLGEVVDSGNWIVDDPGSYLVLSQYGIGCAGGTGKDAGSVVALRTSLELGGSFVLEADGVNVSAGSSGQILGLYVNTVSSGNCFAGFQVNTVGGVTSIQALINGHSSGSSIALDPKRFYVCRIHVRTLEVQRVNQSYVGVLPERAEVYGGTDEAASGTVILEIMDETSGGSSSPITLFSGSVAAIPVCCVLGLYNNINLTCSVKGTGFVRLAPMQVSVKKPGESTFTEQMSGSVTSGASCYMTTSNELAFYPGSIPPSNALIKVVYRAQQRAIAHVATGLSGESLITDSVYACVITHPYTATSVDCANAAEAMLACLRKQSTFMSGKCSTTSDSLDGLDVWPGDFLLFSAASDKTERRGLVESTRLSIKGTNPQEVLLQAFFTDKWTIVSGMAASASIPTGVRIPQGGKNNESSGLNLSSLVVVSVSANTVDICTGVNPPAGGGYEIRSRDGTFGIDNNSDLILRASVQNISIPRQQGTHAYYIRMYDGSTPPIYSAFSVSLFVGLPM